MKINEEQYIHELKKLEGGLSQLMAIVDAVEELLTSVTEAQKDDALFELKEKYLDYVNNRSCEGG